VNKLFSSLTILSLLLLASGPAQAITYAVTDLGTLGGTRSSANGINNSGQVVGTSYVEGTNYYHAFLYSDGTMTDLGTFGGQDPSSASAINNIGQIVGWFTGSDGKQHSFRTAPYSSINPNTDEIAGGSANAINSKGQVVGVSYYGYLTAPNGRFDDTAINLGYGSNPNGINDSSYVVGSNGGAYLYKGIRQN
jgi:probable HAF family extracellular repeat protein